MLSVQTYNLIYNESFFYLFLKKIKSQSKKVWYHKKRYLKCKIKVDDLLKENNSCAYKSQ